MRGGSCIIRRLVKWPLCMMLRGKGPAAGITPLFTTAVFTGSITAARRLGVEKGRLKTGREVYCYAESRDGITFTKPELRLHEYNGSKQNNILWTGVGTHNFAPFLDTRAGCPATSRYKALGGTATEGGLFAFQSADGIHWSLMRQKPVVTEGAFDSQNLAFWDATAGVYRAYFRTFTEGVTTGTSVEAGGLSGPSVRRLPATF